MSARVGTTRDEAMGTTYSVQCRVAGKTAWTTEDGCASLTADEATRAMADLALREPSNEDGETLEYRILEVQS